MRKLIEYSCSCASHRREANSIEYHFMTGPKTLQQLKNTDVQAVRFKGTVT